MNNANDKTPSLHDKKRLDSQNARIEELKASPPKRVLRLLAVQSLLFVVAAVVLFLVFPSNVGARGLSAAVENESWHNVGSIPNVLVASAVAFVLVVIVNFSLSSVAYMTSASFRRATKEAQSTNAIVTELPLGSRVLAFLMGAAGEEISFRWAVFPLSASLLSGQVGVPGEWAVIIGMVLSSAVFAFLHIQYKSAAQLGIVFALGVVFCVSYIASGTLFVPFIAHFGSNMVSAAASPKTTEKLNRVLEERGRRDDQLGG